MKGKKKMWEEGWARLAARPKNRESLATLPAYTGGHFQLAAKTLWEGGRFSQFLRAAEYVGCTVVQTQDDTVFSVPEHLEASVQKLAEAFDVAHLLKKRNELANRYPGQVTGRWSAEMFQPPVVPRSFEAAAETPFQHTVESLDVGSGTMAVKAYRLMLVQDWVKAFGYGCTDLTKGGGGE